MADGSKSTCQPYTGEVRLDPGVGIALADQPDLLVRVEQAGAKPDATRAGMPWVRSMTTIAVAK